MTTSQIINVTNQNFDDVLDNSAYLVIDFWAPWCEPCKDFDRIFRETAADYPEFCFAKINIDEEKELALDFQIKSVPTLAIFRNKVMVLHQSGLMPKKALVDLLNQAKALPEDFLDNQ